MKVGDRVKRRRKDRKDYSFPESANKFQEKGETGRQTWGVGRRASKTRFTASHEEYRLHTLFTPTRMKIQTLSP